MKYAALAAAAAIIFTPLADAQSVREKLQALEDGLNDSSTIIRLASLEEGLADESVAVRQYAMSQALNSGDPVMRSMGVKHFFTTKRNLSISVGKSSELIAAEEAASSNASGMNASALDEFREANRESYGALQQYEPAIVYQIVEYDPVSGSIAGFCMTNLSQPDERYVFSGDVVGDKLNVEHRCDTNWSDMDGCRMELELQDSAKFIGTMRCDSERYPPTVSIAVN